MGLADRSVRDFLEAVASSTPTPGGGSVAALSGALSAALSRMVSALAIGKQGYENVEEELRRLESRGQELQERLLRLVDEDAAAYDAVVAAMRRPKTTETEREGRVNAIQSAYLHATEVPLDTMEACSEALEIALIAAEKGNRSAVTDAGVAALLAQAGVRGASLNARINLAALRDHAVRAQLEERLAAIIEKADKVGHEVMALVEGRL
ncbi:MAG: cyclodeaminase/cyclohydrolase family protein [Candidatus Thermoplasmatota archaeon]